MRERTRLILVASVAALCGLGAALLMRGPGPIWSSESGQRVLQAALEKPAPEGLTIAKRGEPVPPISLKTLEGDTTQLPLPPGKKVLVNVWATWCPPCIEEMPLLTEFAQKQGADGIQVIGIALDEPEPVAAWLERMPSPYPNYLDTPGSQDASVILGNTAGVLPYTVLIDEQGKLIKQRLGPFSSVKELSEWGETSL